MAIVDTGVRPRVREDDGFVGMEVGTLAVAGVRERSWLSFRKGMCLCLG